MPKPLDPAVRAAIVADLRAGTNLSRNALARKHGVSGAMVTKIAAMLETDTDDPIPPPFDRTQTKAATDAAQADNASRRAALERELLTVAEEELARRDQPVVWGNFGGKDNTYAEVTLDRPTFAMRSTLVGTAARAIKAAADLANVGKTDPAVEGKAALLQLVDGLVAQEEAERAAG